MNEGEFPMKMKWRLGKAAMWLTVIVAVAVLVMPVAAQTDGRKAGQSWICREVR